MKKRQTLEMIHPMTEMMLNAIAKSPVYNVQTNASHCSGGLAIRLTRLQPRARKCQGVRTDPPKDQCNITMFVFPWCHQMPNFKAKMH